MILHIIPIALPRNNPPALYYIHNYPNPQCTNSKLLLKYTPVVIMVRYFNLGTVWVTSALAITNESMVPFNPIIPTRNINAWKANTES